MNTALENFRKVFFLMEEREKLFFLKTEDDQYIWNPCRYQIYNFLFSMHKDGYVEEKGGKNLNFLLIKNKVKRQINKLKNYMSMRYIIKKKPNYLFITCQKTKVGDKIEDSITDHLIENITNNAVSIELINKKSISYLRMLLFLETRIPPVAFQESMNRDSLNKFNEIITKSILKYFGVSVNVAELIDYSYSQYRENFKFYSKIFSNYCPSSIIGVNDNNLNGMYAAAKKFKVATIELQHGASNEHTILWSYPKSINVDNIGLSLPDAYFTFSDYWSKNTHYPVRMIKTIGNDNFCLNFRGLQSDGILIVSTYVHHDVLFDLAKELADMTLKKIYFKLHPHEFNRKKEVIKKSEKINNLEVVSNELNFDELFNLCSHVVVVHSSTAYLALQSEKCVCVYMYYNYFFHSDIFEYVKLFKSSTELMAIIDGYSTNLSRDQKVSSVPLFYSRFKIEEYKMAVKDVEEIYSEKTENQ